MTTKKLRLHMITGAPSSGKTTQLIRILNRDISPKLLIYLEGSPTIPRNWGLFEHTHVFDGYKVDNKEVLEHVLNNGVTTVALDYLQMVKPPLNPVELLKHLMDTSVESMIITSQMTRTGDILGLELIVAVASLLAHSIELRISTLPSMALAEGMWH
jgi:hypothetical protein